MKTKYIYRTDPVHDISLPQSQLQFCCLMSAVRPTEYDVKNTNLLDTSVVSSSKLILKCHLSHLTV